MNSLNPQLIFPMCAMFVLSTVALGVMFYYRMKALRTGQIRISFFRNQTDGIKPDSMAKADRQYINLFESPLLFYTVSILALIIGVQSNIIVIFAWVYVTARVAQAFIHWSSNNLNTRPLVFFISWLCMIGMWAIVFMHTLALVS